MRREELVIPTAGRGFHELTGSIDAFVRDSAVVDGLCNVFLPHTSASLLLGENWDPSVRVDLEGFMRGLAPDGDPRHTHRAEGPDDMPAHIRTMLTQNSLVLPVAGAALLLGSWQGIYLWEHRLRGTQRRIILTVW